MVACSFDLSTLPNCLICCVAQARANNSSRHQKETVSIRNFWSDVFQSQKSRRDGGVLYRIHLSSSSSVPLFLLLSLLPPSLLPMPMNNTESEENINVHQLFDFKGGLTLGAEFSNYAELCTFEYSWSAAEEGTGRHLPEGTSPRNQTLNFHF